MPVHTEEDVRNYAENMYRFSITEYNNLYLKSVDLRDYVSLRTLELHPKVRALDISRCASLSQFTTLAELKTLTADNCVSLASVTLPSKVESASLYNCASLKNITIETTKLSGTLNISKCAQLKTLTIPEQNNQIDIDADDCVSLEAVSILSAVHNASFNRCTSIHELQITVTGSVSVTQCPHLSELTIYGTPSLYTIGDLPRLTIFNAPNMSIIPEHAFKHCTDLTTCTTATSVTEIGDSAFEDCWLLSEFAPMGAAEKIGSYAFCNSGITTADTTSAQYLGTYIFYGCKYLKTAKVGYDVSAAMFENCSQLSEVTDSLENPVKHIENSAFRGCRSLRSVSFPEVSIISSHAFAECPIGSVSAPKCTQLLIKPFYECTELQSIDIGNCRSVGDQAFYGCTKLQSIQLPKCTELGIRSFGGCSSLTELVIPACAHVGDYSFIDCSGLTTVEIPECTELGVGAFSQCPELTRIVADNEKLTALPDCLFLGDIKLTEVVTPNVQSIGYGCFYKCESIESVHFSESDADPEDTYKVGDRAFFSCSSLTDVVLPQCTTEIGALAFAYCTALKSMTIPEHVSTIGFNAFLGCHNLEKLFFTGSVPDGFPWGASDTLEIILPESV